MSLLSSTKTGMFSSNPKRLFDIFDTYERICPTYTRFMQKICDEDLMFVNYQLTHFGPGEIKIYSPLKRILEVAHNEIYRRCLGKEYYQKYNEYFE